MNAPRACLAALALAACGSGCSHANYDPVPYAGASAAPTGTAPAASPSPAASAAPQACGTAAPGALFIAAGSYIEPPASPDPTYGSTYGYSLVDSGGDYPLTSSPIVVKPGDTIQFTNVDPPPAGSGAGASHSAAGFTGASFPALPFAFANAEFSPQGTALSSTAPWSTGEIASLPTSLCYSQAFVVPASGTFYFGDLDDFASTNMRDVIVVSAGAAR